MNFIETTLQDIADYFPSSRMTDAELEAYDARGLERILHPTHFQEFWPFYVLICPVGAILALGFICGLVIEISS